MRKTNDLISRSALIAEYDRVHQGPPGGARKLMEDAPAAVDGCRLSSEFAEIQRALGVIEGIKFGLDEPYSSILGAIVEMIDKNLKEIVHGE